MVAVSVGSLVSLLASGVGRVPARAEVVAVAWPVNLRCCVSVVMVPFTYRPSGRGVGRAALGPCPFSDTTTGQSARSRSFNRSSTR